MPNIHVFSTISAKFNISRLVYVHRNSIYPDYLCIIVTSCLSRAVSQGKQHLD